MIQFHSSILQSLKHSGTWAGISAVLGSTAQALPDPHRIHVTAAAGACGVLACLIKSPNDGKNDDSPA